MPLKSPLTLPILHLSIPSFVFGSHSVALPDQPPILLSTNDRGITSLSLHRYRALAQAFAAGLQALHHFAPGDRVFLASSNSVFTAVVFMGTIMAGGVFVGAQHSFERQDLRRQIEDVGPSVILVSEGFWDRAMLAIEDIGLEEKEEELKGKWKQRIYLFDEDVDRDKAGGEVGGEAGEKRVDVDGEVKHWSDILYARKKSTCKDKDKEGEEDNASFQWLEFTTEDEAKQTIASLIYSSGTTGEPKGVALTHYQILASIVQTTRSADVSVSKLASKAAVVTESPPLCYMSMAQVVGQVGACVIMPARRIPVYIAPSFDFVSVTDNVIEFGITTLIIHPGFMIALMKETYMKERMPRMGSLRRLILIGSPVGDETCRQFLRFWERGMGPSAMTIGFHYGMTELAGGIMESNFDPKEGRTRTALRANIEIKIMDLEGHREMPDGTEGELWVRGPNVCQGYWRNDVATSKVFSEDGWFKTGDIASIDRSGNVKVVARKTDLLRIGGQYITPFSIETLLLKHPYIREAVICGVGQKESVPGNKNDSEHTVRAYVIRKEGCKLRPQDVVDFLKQEDCQVQVSPENVFFVSQIPKTTNHKPHKRKLLAQQSI